MKSHVHILIVFSFLKAQVDSNATKVFHDSLALKGGSYF